MWPVELGNGFLGHNSRSKTRIFSAFHGQPGQDGPGSLWVVPRDANVVCIQAIGAGGGGGGGHSAAAGNNRGGGGGGASGAHATMIMPAAAMPAAVWIYVGKCMGGTATNNGQGAAFEGDVFFMAERDYVAGQAAIFYIRGGGGGAKGTAAGGGAGGVPNLGPTTFSDMTPGAQVWGDLVNHNNGGGAGGNAGGAGASVTQSASHFVYPGAGGGSCSNTNVSGAGGDSIGLGGFPTRKGGAAGGANAGAHGVNGFFSDPIGGSTTANAQYHYAAPYLINNGGGGGAGNNGIGGDGGNGGFGSGGGGGGGGTTGGKGGDGYGLIIISWS